MGTLRHYLTGSHMNNTGSNVHDLLDREPPKLKHGNHLFLGSIFVALVILLVSRNLLFFTQPRIWAEEGSVHIQSFLDNGWLASLFLPHLGYYSFFNNYVIDIVMLTLGIKLAPYGTTVFCMLYMTSILLFPLLIESDYWNTPIKKLLVLLSSVLISSGELWLNTVHMQFYFCMFSCYLLIADYSRIKGWRRWYCLFFLFNSALTGVTSVVLLPFYGIKYIAFRTGPDVNKTANALIFLIILGFGLLIQLYSLYYLHVSAHEGGRFNLGYYPNLLSGLRATAVCAIPTVGLDRFPWLGDLYALAKAAFLATIFAILYSRDKERKPIMISLYLVSVFVFLSNEMRGGMRYGYAPAELFVIAIINTIYAPKYKVAVASAVMLFLILSINAISYFNTKSVYDNTWLSYPEALQESERNGGIIHLFPQWVGWNYVIRLPQAKPL